ncbi:MAG: phage tail protein I [Lachnospiraceae bacterium]|nr:phage tail protein I [Lachnospiraceae bacterium]
MIRLGESGLAEMWPDRSSVEIQCLSYALQESIEYVLRKADESGCYSAVDKLQDPILDHLAVELQSMYYDQNMPVNQKREIIKNTLKWYMRAGTTGAVQEMVTVIFGDARIVEWFDFTEWPYTPGTFDIETKTRITEGIYQDMEKYIRQVKNVRSHLRKIRFDRQETVTIVFGGMCGNSDMEQYADDCLQQNQESKLQDTYCGACLLSTPETVIKMEGQ